MDNTGATPAPAPAWGRRVLIAVVIVVCAILIYLLGRRLVLGADRFTIETTRPVVSRVDGMQYRVHENHSSPQRAADALATLNGQVIDLLRHLRTRYLARGGGFSAHGDAHPARRAAVTRLLTRYNPDNLAENSPKDPSGDTSYTLDKGAVVAICLRERDPTKSGDPTAYDIHDLSTLSFVTLHEMAHIAIDAVDHPPEFWSAFRFLLEEAEEGGIYTSPNFAARPRYYCGVTIDYNPRYDANTVPI